MTRLRVATYNVHSGVGVDRRFRPQRIVDVIAELSADVVALQEVLSPVRGFDVHAHLRAGTGLHLVSMATMQLAGGTFGNAVLSRWPIIDVVEHGLTVASREPRGALEVTIGRDLRELRVIATHLGLRASERAEQLACLLSIAQNDTGLPIVLAGDLNVTRARARELRACAAYFGQCKVLATFPSIAPVLPLDRILAASGARVVDIAVHRSRRARMASDHLPLVATVELTS
jgi:endonuclease/exonuclease/phosphatase family metal-dependent hydrolase